MAMGWHKGKYYYSVWLIRYLAEHWDNLYDDGIGFEDYEDTNPWSIAEYRADFSIAIKKVGRRMRKSIEEYIKGTPDRVMEMRGYYEVASLREKAYVAMVETLNERGKLI